MGQLGYKVGILRWLVPVLAAGCVTTQSGPQATFDQVSLRCQERSDFVAQNSMILSCRLTNHASEGRTVTVESVEPIGSHSARVLTAEEIELAPRSFEGTDHERQILRFFSTLVVGTMTVIAGSQGGGSPVGSAAAIGVAFGPSASRSQTPSYSMDHLLSGQSDLAPNEHVDKSLVLGISEWDDAPHTLRVCLSLPSSRCVNLPLASDHMRARGRSLERTRQD